MYEEVLDDLKVHELERIEIKPFMTFGFNMFHAGMSGTKTGGIIGMPSNLAFTSPKQIEPNKILINNMPLDLSRKESEDLIQSLILSRDAKKFAIAREVLTYLESNKVVDCIIGSAIFIMSYTVCQWLKEKYDMYKKPLRSRVLVYAAVGFGGIQLYYTQKDFMFKRTEEKVDKKLVQLSPAYAKGGQEFYSKSLARNIAHRSLLDKNGDKLFDEKGNLVSYFRKKTIPLSERKTLFDSKIEQFMEEQTNLLNPELSDSTPQIQKA